MNEFFGSVWWLLVTLGLLVTFHEFGHFVVARRCGVKVLKFSIGFGRGLWSRIDRRGTEFVVAMVPLGGYVKMLDEREGDVAPAELGHAYNRKSVGVRMAIAAAGPAFNLIFTLAAFWLMFVIGKPDYQPVIGHVDHIAASAGFAKGDRVTAIGGDPIETWTDASTALLQGAMDRRDLPITVVDAGGTERARSLPLSQLQSDTDEQDLYREIGLAPRQWAVPPVIGSVQPGSAAARAGLQPGDRIRAINADPITDWRDVPAAIAKFAAPETPLKLQIERGGQTQILQATPVRSTPGATAAAKGAPSWLLGIGAQPVSPDYDATLRYGPLEAIPKAFAETWQRSRETLGMLGRMVTGQASLKNLSGVITIAQVANSSAQMGLAWFLNFLAIISLSLAILNLLPIPILDGGHLLYYLIELITGSPVSEKVQLAGQYVGLTLLVALMGLAFYNDILRIAS